MHMAECFSTTCRRLRVYCSDGIVVVVAGAVVVNVLLLRDSLELLFGIS